MIPHHIKRFTHPVRGIWYAIRKDRGYRFQVISITSAIAVAVYLLKPLNQTEILFLGLAYVLILITELQNSSFEAALDRMHPEHHDEIGRSKDMAAGAVLTAGFFLVFVLFIVLFLFHLELLNHSHLLYHKQVFANRIALRENQETHQGRAH